MKNSIKAALAGASIACASMASAADLNFAGGWPPNSGPTKAIEGFAEAVGEYSNGEVNVRVFPLSLLSFGEINGGLQDGIADMAVNLTPYFPAEFPNLNMLAEYAMLTELEEFSGELAAAAYSGAITEYIITNCPDCMNEVAAQNQVYMGSASSSVYALQCVVPLETVDDLKGKRIRAAGAYWARWAETVGAVPVSMSINETLEGLNQGVVDCTASNTADFLNFGFVDVVDHVYLGLPGSLFIAPFSMNKDTWNGLSASEKTALIKGNAKLMADMTWVFVEEGRAGREKAEEKGITYETASPELVALNREFVANDKDGVAAIYKERFGIEGGSDALAAMTELLGKWTALVSDATGPEDLSEIYWNEIFAKMDVANYGK
ncbi:C4-dicarboxylate TRAP transporter substrate-binding protein [Ruegeria sp.]|uniref:C4-dicarboxylate TRAP transporter substrate-binding protein n=1 Tax=Ruegeria sp. TaxID=1879320 RepID=UPI003B5C7FF9